jgi:hypothetical protein
MQSATDISVKVSAKKKRKTEKIWKDSDGEDEDAKRVKTFKISADLVKAEAPPPHTNTLKPSKSWFLFLVPCFAVSCYLFFCVISSFVCM